MMTEAEKNFSGTKKPAGLGCENHQRRNFDAGPHILARFLLIAG